MRKITLLTVSKISERRFSLASILWNRTPQIDCILGVRFKRSFTPYLA